MSRRKTKKRRMNASSSPAPKMSEMIWEFAGDFIRLGETLGETSVVGAEVLNAIRNEMAASLSDIVFRRTDLATAGDPGDAALHAALDLASREFGWSGERAQSELRHVRRRLRIPGN